MCATRTDNEIVHADVALAGNFLRLEVVVGELVDRKMLYQAYPLSDADLFVLGQLLRAVLTCARRRIKYRLNVLLKR